MVDGGKMKAFVSTMALGFLLIAHAGPVHSVENDGQALLKKRCGRCHAVSAQTVYANGLPIPKPFTDKVASNSRFRVAAHTTVSASVASVVAFYRAELSKLGWTEDAAKSRTEPNKFVLVFHAPEGPAILTVTQLREGTGADLVLRKTTEAKTSGLFPRKGMTTVVIGNSANEPAAVTINGKTYQLGPGEGTGQPNGPRLDLAPGTYKASTMIGSKSAVVNHFTIGADEIWGLLLGTGGSSPLQMY